MMNVGSLQSVHQFEDVLKSVSIQIVSEDRVGKNVEKIENERFHEG